jgi:hypothetical protein
MERARYKGTDGLRGPFQNETGSDGIGDTPYFIDSKNVDNYPLVKPYSGPNDIGIVNVTSSWIIPVPVGTTVYINVKIINYGIATETFQLTIKAHSSVLNSQTITLDARDSTTIQYPWVTSGFTEGNYTISASAGSVPNEWATDDNTYTDGPVMLYVPQRQRLRRWQH